MTGLSHDLRRVIQRGSRGLSFGTPFVRRSSRFACAALLLLLIASLSGCGIAPGGGTYSAPAPVSAGEIHGLAHGGYFPVTGATVTLWYPGVTGFGSTPTSLATTTTGSGGNFSFSVGSYTCPASDMPVYITITGGNPGLSSTSNWNSSSGNSYLALMAAIGSCSSAASQTGLVINEVTTVAAVFATAQFSSAAQAAQGSNGVGATSIGSISGTTAANGGNIGAPVGTISAGTLTVTNALGYTALKNAFATAAVLANVNTGLAGPAASISNATVPTTKINSVADILASCVQTDGVAADSALCANLAATTTGVAPSGLTVAVDTVQIAQYMALSPANNVSTVFNTFVSAEPIFESTLSTAPFDWTLAVTYTSLGLSYPQNLAVDASGQIWVIGHSGTMGLAGISATGQSLNSGTAFLTSSYFSSPTSILVDNSGYVWVSNRITGTNDLVQFNPAITTTAAKFNAATNCAPGGLTLDPSLSAIYDCTGISTPKYPLNAFQNAGSTSSPSYNSSPTTFSNPATTTSGTAAQTLHSDNSGNIWVPGNSNCTIAEMIPGSYSGSPSLPTAYILNATYTGTGTAATDLAIDHAANVWFPCNTTLNELAAGSSSPTASTGGGLDNAQNMAIDGAGNIWIVNGTPATIGATNYFTVSEFNNSGTAITPALVANISPGGYSAFSGSSTTSAGMHALAIDAAGNVWVPDALSGATLISELIGVAAPTYNPLGTAPLNNRLGSLPFSSPAASPNFTLSLSSQNLAISAGGQQAFTLTVNPNNGFTSLVTVTLSGLPSGVTSDKSSYTLAINTPTTVTLTAASNAASTIASVTATGTSGSLTQYTTTTLTVGTPPDFSVSADPQSVPLSTGSSATFNITAAALHGFSGTVTATLSGLPSGVTSDQSSYTVTPGIPAVVTLTASSGASNIITAVTITGTASSIQHTASIELTVGTPADYSLVLTPIGVNVPSNSSQTITVSINNLNGFSSTTNVAVQISSLPSGVTASPSTFNVSANSPQTVTLTGGSGLSSAVTYATVSSSYGSISHNVQLVVNTGSQAQDFVLSTTNTLNIAASGSASLDVYTTGVAGFTGNVTVQLSGLPSGVTSNPSGSFTLYLTPGGSYTNTVTLNATNGISSGTVSFTVKGTSGSLTHSNTIVLTLRPNTTETATINPASPGAAFPSYYIGISAPASTLQEFTGTGSTTNAGFINLLRNLSPYIGSPSIRTTISSSTSTSTINQIAALTTGATFTNNSVTTSPKFYFTVSSSYQPSTYAGIVQRIANAIGTANILGVELDNEPDSYVSNGYRDSNWSLPDYLTESSGYEQAMSTYVTAPGFIATAAAGNSWDPGTAAVATQLSGQLASYTAHRYGQSACSGTPTIANQLVDSAAHRYYGRFAPLVQTLGSTPVRMGEMNSVACSGTSGVSNTLSAALWLIDTLFEGKSAGVAGFNIHSGGTVSGGAVPYDIAYLNNSGTTTVFAPYYGMLFFAQAIQNGAQPIPVTITQSSGNIKIWATIDNSGVVRVMVLEKDTDGASNTRTVALNLGSSYTAAATLTTLTGTNGVSETSNIYLAGQTFNGTTNGLLTGTANSSSVTPSGGVYTITVADGSAALLTIP